MSVHSCIPDVPLARSEGRFMTQSVNCESFGLDRNGLVSPPYPGLETIRNQTLPKAITDWRVSPQGGSAPSSCFWRRSRHSAKGGFQNERRLTIIGLTGGPHASIPELTFAINSRCGPAQQPKCSIGGSISLRSRPSLVAPPRSPRVPKESSGARRTGSA
jgi:hypothetical protein